MSAWGCVMVFSLVVAVIVAVVQLTDGDEQ